jgi:hypothetical protein
MGHTVLPIAQLKMLQEARAYGLPFALFYFARAIEVGLSMGQGCASWSNLLHLLQPAGRRLIPSFYRETPWQSGGLHRLHCPAPGDLVG